MLGLFTCSNQTTMKKKRLLIANDASFLDTGYGIYGKELISRLHNSGKYEVAELGCYAEKNHPKIKLTPWKFYPNAVSMNDQRIDHYKSSAANQFGAWRFNRVLADFKPHIVFDVRDYWMYSYQEISPYKKYFHWVIMPTTDSAPPKLEWLYTFANADIIVPYTKWAYEVLSNTCGSSINMFPKIANAGINSTEFFPVQDKKQHQKTYFGKEVSIVGAVMRNQKRKLLADLMVAYKKYLNKLIESGNMELYEKSYLYLHTTYPEDNGWDLPSLLLEHNLLDKTYFTYICRQCNKFFPSKFQNAVTKCPHCNNRSATVCGPSHGVNTQQLNEVYNLFDLFIQYAICEGFGMPQVEAAACGLKIASIDYSAMTEIVENLDGIKIPLKTLFREMETNADRSYPDNDATSNIIYDYMVNVPYSQKLQERETIRNKCLSLYTWDDVYKVWDECFDSIDINKKPSWDHKETDITNPNLKVPKGLEIPEFIEFICNNIIKSPELLKTSHIQTLIKDSISGIIARNGTLSSINHEQVIQILEGHLNNKIMCDKMRTDPGSLVKEDFI
jgi:glycosyltransferase involved in cell wall biosynthesis